MKLANTVKLAVAVAAFAALTLTAIPANASTGPVPKPKAINWSITYTQFGKHKLNESVATAAKISGINYASTLKKEIYQNGQIFCEGPVRIPLVKSGVHKQNVWAMAYAPCDEHAGSWANYVKKHNLYKTLKLSSFISSEEDWNGGFAPNYAYGHYLPHAKISIGDWLTDLKKAYAKGAKVNTSYGYTESDGTFTGPVIITKSNRLADRQHMIVADVDHNSIDSIALEYRKSGTLG